MARKIILSALFLTGLFAGFSALATAQDNETPPVQTEQEAQSALEKQRVNPNEIPSLLFTHWEHAALMDAKRSIGAVRAPTQAELNAANREEGYTPPPESRELKLGGIVYKSKEEWTIYLNDTRVTPKALPPDVIDLRVYEEYIDMKWFDAYTNQIFPVRLRPHQRFNLDTRIFLPG